MSSPEPTRDRSLHLTILAGSVIIAVGLFLGLRSRPLPAPSAPDHPPAASSTTAPAASAAQANATPRPPGEGPPPPAAMSDELKSTAAKQAAAALEAERAEIVKKCWAPAIKANPVPAKAKFLYDVSFDADGKEIARGISDVRGMERPDVGQCLREQPLTLRIPPPGVGVGNLIVPFSLP